MNEIKGFLIDLDGVIYNDTVPIEGAAQTIQWLDKNRYPYRFITNTTMKSRKTLRKKLADMGIEASESKIFSAAYAAARYVKSKGDVSCFLMLTEDAKREYSGLESDSENVDYVIAGDLGEQITFDILNEAFVRLFNGAELIALQKNRYWLSDRGYTLDAGAFVALLEFAANVESVLIGKPAKPFFETALNDLNLPAGEVLMIGDDIESDIIGASNLGINTCLVKKGKFEEKNYKLSGVKPDFLLNSIAELPESGIM